MEGTQKPPSEEEMVKYAEMQKKQMEEQKKMQKLQLEMGIEQLESQKKLVEKTIARMEADCEVVEKVNLPEEKNEIVQKALKAKLAEMQAERDVQKFALKSIEVRLDLMRKQLENIDKMPMMPPQGRQQMMGPGMGRLGL